MKKVYYVIWVLCIFCTTSGFLVAVDDNQSDKDANAAEIESKTVTQDEESIQQSIMYDPHYWIYLDDQFERLVFTNYVTKNSYLSNNMGTFVIEQYKGGSEDLFQVKKEGTKLGFFRIYNDNTGYIQGMKVGSSGLLMSSGAIYLDGTQGLQNQIGGSWPLLIKDNNGTGINFTTTEEMIYNPYNGFIEINPMIDNLDIDQVTTLLVLEPKNSFGLPPTGESGSRLWGMRCNLPAGEPDPDITFGCIRQSYGYYWSWYSNNTIRMSVNALNDDILQLYSGNISTAVEKVRFDKDGDISNPDPGKAVYIEDTEGIKVKFALQIELETELGICDSLVRGTLKGIAGNYGQADALYFCQKMADGSFQWIEK
ncbi:MAG: hypothetical protein A2Y62_11915 [Candidatus Fischerbacteria bacterium RBG_13_37_8]|uniref:Uncharacterized protein n=1 Tax=Candidatus Fischerbacteria bacterium RBG_13_37_8 TaxID=1817863 RepID=A0A1F5VP41_9BACT|nr:MAG: hypothetical protein A2Y62_11915 [Candidatus Fischerbacteria bacterium RBG_13_37_8]